MKLMGHSSGVVGVALVLGKETNMRHLMPLLAAAVLALSTAPAYADLGDQLVKLLPNDGASLEEFGSSVAISGTTAIVGKPRSSKGAGGASCTHPLFAAAVAYAAGNAPRSVAIGDLDGVNGPDLAVANLFSDDVSVLLNQGDGTFAAAVAYDPGNSAFSVAIGDLDGVNGPDLAVTNDSHDLISVLLNQGDGTFAAAVAYDAGNGPVSVAIDDLDGVNGPDLAVANFNSDGVSVLLNLCGTLCPWDCQSLPDGGVGISDFLALLSQWGNPTPCDFDGGGVGINDFLELLANWGACP